MITPKFVFNTGKKRGREELLLSWDKPACIAGGGVIRNEDGEWVAGFAANFGTGKVIEAEIKALHKVLELASESELAPLQLETDSKLVVNLLSNVDVVYKYHYLIELIKSCNDIFKRNSTWTLRHVYRQKNCVADSLAGLGVSLEEGVTIYYDAPPDVSESILVEDQCMVARSRLISFNKLKNQGNVLVPRCFRLKKHYDHSIKKVGEGDGKLTTFLSWILPPSITLIFLLSENLNAGFGDFGQADPSDLKGNVFDYLSPYLDVLEASTLPQGWSRCARFSLTVVNQLQPSKSITKEAVHVFSDCGFRFLVPLSWFSDHGNEYLINDTCILEA